VKLILAELVAQSVRKPDYIVPKKARFDRRSAGGYTRTGGLYRVDWSDYRQTNAGAASFVRVHYAEDLRDGLAVLVTGPINGFEFVLLGPRAP
jgi:hypothetical protein